MLDRMQGVPGPKDDHFPEEWVGSTTSPDPDAEGRGLSQVLPADGSIGGLKQFDRAMPDAMLARPTSPGRDGVAVLCKILDRPCGCRSRCTRTGPSPSGTVTLTSGKRVLDHSRHAAVSAGDPIHPLRVREGSRGSVQALPGPRTSPARWRPSTGSSANRARCTSSRRGPPRHRAGCFMIEVQSPTISSSTPSTRWERSAARGPVHDGLGFGLAMQCFDYRATGVEHVRRCTKCLT